MSNATQTVRLSQVLDYQFEVDFGDEGPRLLVDEPAPLGNGKGPSPVQLLATSVGNCLSASLLFALRKFKQQPEPISCEVEAEVGRNAEGRLRVLSMAATLRLGVPRLALQHLERVLGSFESYCTVTQSVGAAIPIQVVVVDSEGVRLN